jgi:hypothetical protein
MIQVKRPSFVVVIIGMVLFFMDVKKENTLLATTTISKPIALLPNLKNCKSSMTNFIGNTNV